MLQKMKKGKKEFMNRLLMFSMSAVMALSAGGMAYADGQALPNGTVVTENGVRFLEDSSGEKYSGWFMDAKGEWFYFNESDKTMKTG